MPKLFLKVGMRCSTRPIWRGRLPRPGDSPRRRIEAGKTFSYRGHKDHKVGARFIATHRQKKTPLAAKACPESFGSTQDRLRRRDGKGAKKLRASSYASWLRIYSVACRQSI